MYIDIYLDGRHFLASNIILQNAETYPWAVHCEGPPNFIWERGERAKKLAACPEHTCSGRCPETSLLPYYACSCWSPLASYPLQNKFQNCYHRFQGIAFPAAFLSRCPSPTVCAHAITAIFLFLVNMHSLTKNYNGRSKSFSSVASDTWNRLPCHLSSISALPAFMKRLKHHLFSTAFPGISSPSTDITLCDVIASTNVKHTRCTLPPS